MRIALSGLVVSAALLTAVGCSSAGDGPEETAETTTAETSTTIEIEQVATVGLTSASDSTVRGLLTATPSADGVRLAGMIEGLPPNTEHGFHIHETGDCSAPDASSAGGHFNPTDEPHGRAGAGEHHGGDADNLVSDADGFAEVDTDFVGLTLGDGAPTDVLGRAVVVHADPDDYVGQPAGNSGARVACGVITEE